jgi:5-methylcytosine-specific restriction endonuclease McrA
MLILKEEWQSNPKILKAVFLAQSPAVKHFWFELLSASANANTDGIIEVYRIPLVAQSCGIDLETASRFLRALIDCNIKPTGAGLFHDAASLARCTACKLKLKEQGHKPGPDDVVAHDFLQHNPANRDKTPLGRLRVKRKNWLKRNGKDLKIEVYRRDQGLCRYCGGRPVEGADGPDELEFDHVDPDPTLEPNNGNFADNLVTSHKSCNTRKGQRTPEEAGMPLLAVGITRRDVLEGRAAYVATPSEVPSTAGVGVGSGADPARFGRGSDAAQGRIATEAQPATRSTSRKPSEGPHTNRSGPEARPP